MKKSISLIVLICMVFSFAGCSKNENPATDFKYSATNGEICITGYIGNDVTVIIPEKIEGLPVVTIGVSAFWSTKIQAVTIPASVTKIESMAFYNCENLKSVKFLGNAPYSIILDAFKYTHKDFKIYYKKGTAGWEGKYKVPITNEYTTEEYQ